MNINKYSLPKIILTAVIIIILHVLVILLSITGYEIYESRSEERRFKDSINAGETETGKQIAGMIFEYDFEYGLENGETRDYSGKETYYWDGKNLIPASEFMKGYE